MATMAIPVGPQRQNLSPAASAVQNCIGRLSTWGCPLLVRLIILQPPISTAARFTIRCTFMCANSAFWCNSISQIYSG
jgi:hypothetical protein